MATAPLGLRLGRCRETVELDPEVLRSAMRERSVYMVRPKAKVLAVKDAAGVPVVVRGLANTASLAGTIRNGLEQAA